MMILPSTKNGQHFFLFLTEMMRDFKMGLITCEAEKIDGIAVNISYITTNENEHHSCEVHFEPSTTQSRMSYKFTCGPLISISKVALKHEENEKICITSVSLETLKKKFLKEGLRLELEPNQWSKSIKPFAFG